MNKQYGIVTKYISESYISDVYILQCSYNHTYNILDCCIFFFHIFNSINASA